MREMYVFVDGGIARCQLFDIYIPRLFLMAAFLAEKVELVTTAIYI